MITIIAAMDKNNVIGNKGKIPWLGDIRYKEDLQRFKSLTIGHPVIMGRVTYESLKKPLVNRTNIIVSSTMKSSNGIVIAKNIEEALDKARRVDNQIYVIGGEKIYQATMGIADMMEITRINQEYEGDTFFPQFDETDWKLAIEYEREDYSFLNYIRRL